VNAAVEVVVVVLVFYVSTNTV